MHLGVDPIARFVDELESVPAVAVHVPVAVGDTTVTHEDEDLVHGLGVLGEVVPEHGRVIGAAQVGGGMPLLGVDEVRELGWVAQEKYGCVVGDHVPIALFRAELDAKASRIASTVVGTGFATDRREADRDGAFFACLAEDIGLAKIVERLGALEGTVGTTPFGVDDSLGDSLTVEVGDEIDQVEILE